MCGVLLSVAVRVAVDIGLMYNNCSYYVFNDLDKISD